MLKTVKEDIQTVYAKDPAAGSVSEVVLRYPGLHALWMHRAAHYLWRHNLRLVLKDQHQSKERLRRLENASGVTVPDDGLYEPRREIKNDFLWGEGI